MKKIILRIILILIIFAVIGLFVYDYVVNGVPPTENLVRGCCILFLTILAFIRTFHFKQRNTLQFYDDFYSKILEHAFIDQPLWRKKLLCAVRLFNENKYDKSIKYLFDLKKKAKTFADHYAVDLFAALCFTDMGLYDQAIHIYQHLISTDRANSTIFSNLGYVQLQNGDYEDALKNYNIALRYDENNAMAYNNIAQAYFQIHKLEEAIPFAQKTLEINPKLHNASSLLAIIYALLDDKENSEKYFHMAISSGRKPQELIDAIEYYRSAQHAWDEEPNEEDK